MHIAVAKKSFTLKFFFLLESFYSSQKKNA